MEVLSRRDGRAAIPHRPGDLSSDLGTPCEARTRAIAGALLAIALPAIVLALVLGDHLAGGDSGQWAMLARAYQGLPLPEYRDPLAVPPAAPLLVLAFAGLTGDSYLAPKLALVVAASLLGLGAYAAGRELFGWTGGLLSLVMVAAVQPFYVRLAVFGALPQLLSLAAFAFTLAAIARWARRPSDRGQAFVAAGCLGILSAHAPTAAVAFPVLGLTLLALPPWLPLDLGAPALLSRAFERVRPLLPAGVLLAGYTLLKRGAFEGYLNNEAAYHTKGLAAALHELLRFQSASIALVAAGLILLFLIVRGFLLPAKVAAARGAPVDPALPAILLGLPCALLGVIVLALHAAHVGTDYPRIFPLMALPALMGVGILAPHGPRRSAAAATTSPAMKPGPPPARAGLGSATSQSLAAAGFAPRPSLALGMAGLLLLPAATSAVVAGEQRAVPYYTVGSPADLRAVLDEVDRRVPTDATVWTSVREGKWLEGTTGRAALFALPAWAIFRPWEWERKAAAETLATASVSVSTGQMAASFQLNSRAGTSNPTLQVYDHGNFSPVLRVDEARSGVRLDLPGMPEVAFSALTERAESVHQEADRVAIIQTVAGNAGAGAPQARIEVVRQAIFERGSSLAQFDVTVHATGAPLALAWVGLRVPDNAAWTVTNEESHVIVATSANEEGPALRLGAFPAATARLSALPRQVASAGLEMQMSPSADNSSRAHAILLAEARPLGTPDSDLRVFTAAGVLEAYHVSWALLPRDGNAATWRASATALGFQPVYENPTYVLYERAPAQAPMVLTSMPGARFPRRSGPAHQSAPVRQSTPARRASPEGQGGSP